MSSCTRAWAEAKVPICRILNDAYKRSSFTRKELAEKLHAYVTEVSNWFRNRPPSPSNCLDLAELLNIDIIDEIRVKTDAQYFWVYFKDFLNSIWCYELPSQGRNVIGRWIDEDSEEHVPNPQAMRWIYNYVGNKEGFKEMVAAWFPLYYCEKLKAEKAKRESGKQESSLDAHKEDSEYEYKCPDELPVKLEVPMDGTKEHPMTFYIHLDRVKAFALEHGWSYIPDDLELYTSMVVAYAYQFFYGDSCDVLPRHLPTLSSEGGSYYYMSEDPTVGSCQIKSLKDFDFGGYLRARGVIPVITFDKEQDTMFRNLQ